MITEDYVSLETAKLLKDKGYWNMATMLYKENGDLVNYNVPLNNKGFSSTLGVFYEAPTLQTAMKWLREVHKKFIDVYSYSDSFGEFIHGWSFFIRPLKYVESIGWNWDDSFKAVTDKNMSDDKTYKTYEEACEAAIKYCLENLI